MLTHNVRKGGMSDRRSYPPAVNCNDLWNASSYHKEGLLITFTVAVISDQWYMCWNITRVLQSRVAAMRHSLPTARPCRRTNSARSSWRNLGAQLLGLEFLHRAKLNLLQRTTDPCITTATLPFIHWVPRASSRRWKDRSVMLTLHFPSITEVTNKWRAP